uniref:Cyclin-dependent kinase-like 5 n=1 Tax=Sipha flava TaxID=143950 RepID=A0A2S2QRV1_9HEMI
MERYQMLGIVGEGSFGVVAKCLNKTTGRTVAVKKLLDSKRYPVTVVREISLLHAFENDHVMPMIEAFRHCGYIYIVFPYMRRNLYMYLEMNNGVLTMDEAKICVYQVRTLGINGWRLETGQLRI